MTVVMGPALTDGTRGRSFEQSELLAPFITELIIRNWPTFRFLVLFALMNRNIRSFLPPKQTDPSCNS